MLFTDVSSARTVAAFKKMGFWISTTRGKKHIGMSNGFRKLTIPRHSRVNPYTLKGIIKDAGITAAEFKKLL